MVREYQDNGYSGISSDRPGFQEMMAHALSEEEPFNTIIVRDVPRFSREASDLSVTRGNWRRQERGS